MVCCIFSILGGKLKNSDLISVLHVIVSMHLPVSVLLWLQQHVYHDEVLL